MDVSLREILNNSQQEQNSISIITSAGTFTGVVSKVHNDLVEIREKNSKRYWIVIEKIQAVSQD